MPQAEEFALKEGLHMFTVIPFLTPQTQAQALSALQPVLLAAASSTPCTVDQIIRVYMITVQIYGLFMTSSLIPTDQAVRLM